MLENLLSLLPFLVDYDSPWVRPAAALLVIIIAFLARGIFTRIIFKLILRLTFKTGTHIDKAIVQAFENPVKTLILVVGLYLALGCLQPGPNVMEFALTLLRSIIIILIAWGLYKAVGGEVLEEVGEKLSIDQIIIEFSAKVIRFVIIALTIAIIAQEWDYDVNGFIAGLGLGGLAFALAAKDTVANIFGGIVIMLDKPFDVGDWILTPSVEGTVEEMSFRSTKVRTFPNALVTVPNTVLANEAVTNWTRMNKRQITFNLGVTYTTPRAKLQTCVRRIKDMLQKHPAVHPDTIFVRFNSFGDNSLNIFLYFFTRTTVWAQYLEVREELNFKIMEILEEEGVSVAFPSRSLYFEERLETAVVPNSDANFYNGAVSAEPEEQTEQL